MEDQRFDNLVKRLCTTRLTRLSALRGLAGGAAAALAGAVLASDESEAKKARGQSKNKKARGQNKKKSRAQSQNKRVRSQSQDLTAQADVGATACKAFGDNCQINPGHGSECCTGEAFCSEDPGQPGHGTCACEDTLAEYCANNDSCYLPEAGECCTNDDCDPGEICNDQNTCVPECDPPCDPGEVCNNGVCEPECDSNDDCDEGEVCDIPNGVCVPCGAEGQPCCDVAEGDGCDGALICNPNDICEPEEPDCGALGQPCCLGEGDGCDGDLVCNPQTDICVACTNDTHCGQDGVCCDNVCFEGDCCENAECPGGTCVNHECVQTPPSPGPDCPADAVLVGGRCVFLGLRCKTTETPLKCCFRAVAKGCRRKQQSSKARKNCLKRGKKRCKKLLTGV